MKRVLCAFVGIAMGITLFGCNGKPDKQSAPTGTKESIVTSKDGGNDADVAIMFLRGIQQGDKKLMYEATNLTQEMVNDSRDKLIHPDKYKLSSVQVSEHERVLRVSGEIDFFVAKLKKLLPNSASFAVVKTTVKGTGESNKDYSHTVKISYGNKAEAMQDKSGQAIKEMTIELQHAVTQVSGRAIHEVSFSSNDFEKMADKEFTVSSYY